jgi:hypothetical protein
MTYSDIYRILSFEKTKLITKNNYVHKEFKKSSSIVVWSNMEPKNVLTLMGFGFVPKCNCLEQDTTLKKTFTNL